MRIGGKFAAAIAIGALAIPALGEEAGQGEAGASGARHRPAGICPPHGNSPFPCYIISGGRDIRNPGSASGQTARTAAPAIALNGAGAMFPHSAYNNRHQIPRAAGSIQAAMTGAPADPLTLEMQLRGLAPNKAYIVFLDKDGTTPTPNHSFGPWTQVGQFTTNAAGNASFQYRAAPGSITPGAHTWAVFVNRADAGAAVLISDNFSFTMP